MKTTTLARNGVSTEMVGLISRLVDLIPWPARRCAMGDAALLLLDGKHRVAENVFGWSRSAVEVGINEFQNGIVCVNGISTRLKPKTEEKNPELLAEIHAIMEPHSGQNQGSKKTAETDAIFENIRQINALADADTETLRISIDTKATVHVGDCGRSRGVVAVKAFDHDMCTKDKLALGGILEPVTGRSFLFFGANYKTSDFMVDGMFLWWEERKQEFSGLKQLVINLDNGPSNG
jgi:hypothetical protein